MRDFIEETISTLRWAADGAEEYWNKFKAGEISKEEFEGEYGHFLHVAKEQAGDEAYTPNNGCRYNVTNPCKYFEDNKY
jgi:hypothetical protein